MKKQYTKKQITEAIAYWKKQLKSLNESNIDAQNYYIIVTSGKIHPRLSIDGKCFPAEDLRHWLVTRLGLSEKDYGIVIRQLNTGGRVHIPEHLIDNSLFDKATIFSLEYLLNHKDY